MFMLLLGVMLRALVISDVRREPYLHDDPRVNTVCKIANLTKTRPEHR